MAAIIEEYISLRPFNSFGIEAKARYFCRIGSIEALQELVRTPFYQQHPRLVLGGGSNLLFTRDYPGLIIKIDIRGIEVVSESDEHVVIRVGAGEIWHQLVLYCVSRGWGGIENLSLIPGTAGAAPIQNIGAYGVEVAEVIEDVTTVDALTGALRSFKKDECAFGYRESAFKSELKEKFFISSVTLTLTKKNHLINIRYGALHDAFKMVSQEEITIKKVSDAVIAIRESKLPDPVRIGNAGSFFKNPILTLSQLEALRRIYPAIPSYSSDNQNVKVPAAWLIEQCGWKGKRINQVGVHVNQALVLVNYGGGTGDEILQLSKQIQSDVLKKFDVNLTPEVNII